VIRYKNKEKYKEWFDDECKQALDIKKPQKMLQKETSISADDYKEAHRQGYKVCKKEGKEYESE
jgi:hypothetical protein